MLRLTLAIFVLLLRADYTPTLTEVCPGVGIQQRTADFTPGGIILTSFDRSSLWVYNIDRDTRYPLPETRPCGSNCRLSPDARWITFIDPQTGSFGKMRLDGTQRTRLTDYASDVQWWDSDRLLIWTPGHQAYLRAEAVPEDREALVTTGIVSIQPGGRWGLEVLQAGDDFARRLVNLQTRGLQGIAEQRLDLGEDRPYYNAGAWSPNGERFAYVAPGTFDESVNAYGSELFTVAPRTGAVTRLTDLYAAYGAVRVNGRSSTDLSWSPDGSRLAFWVIELLGPEVETDTGTALLHVLDTGSGELRAYCGFTTDTHTPTPPRLIWSPDSTHVAFGGNIPGDERGYLLLALDIESGIFTELSEGIYPALGTADPVAWGLPPF